MTFDTVTEILRTSYAWAVCPSARPEQSVVEEALAAGQTADQIAAALTAYAERIPPPPPGYPDRSASGIWAFKLLRAFGAGCHFRLLNTAQALGLAAADPVSPSIPPAHTAEDAVEGAIHGWHYTGDTRFIELDTPEGKAEFDRRAEFAKTPPLSWQTVDATLYWYLVVVNRLPSVVPPFGVRVSEQLKSVYGLNLQKWLDNEWALRDMVPLPWLPSGEPNPKVKP